MKGSIAIFVVLLMCLLSCEQGVASVLSDELVITEEELAIVQEQEVYTVGYTTNYIPISYEIKGEPAGILIDILNDMGEELGVTFEFVDMDEPGVVVEDLDITVLMPNFSTNTMSETYLSYQQVLATKVNHEGMIETVAVQVNHGLTEVDSAIADATLVYYDDFAAAKAALDGDEVDALLMATIGYDKVSDEVMSGIYDLTILDTPLNFRFSYSEQLSSEVIEVMNFVIANLDEDDIYFLAQNHSNYMVYTEGISEYILDNLNIILLGVLIGAVIVSIVAMILQSRKQKRLECFMAHDPLTGLLSEAKFKEEVARIIHSNHAEIYHILALDMDNFKYINEIYGFSIGTEIIQEAARGLYDTLQSVEHTMTRSFADNFYILISGIDILGKLTGYEDGYNETKEKLSKIVGEDFNFSFSLGLYTITDIEEDVTLMMDCATIARNLGKNTLGYTIYPYTEAMQRERKIKNGVVATMEAGVARKEFIIYYQPKVDLHREHTTGAEALVRWVRDGKLVPPGEFIPIFEKNGFIETLDYYVLDAVCEFIANNQHKEIPVISVNLSGITVMKSTLVESILAVLERHKIQPNQIDLEITESAFVNHFEESIKRLELLRQHGFTISMDDFGAGVSSLHRLKVIPLDILKIDREFITDSIGNDKGTAIIENITNMAKEINLETVAEGIETQEQLDFLKKIGCNVGQGYFYSRPLPEKEFLEYLLQTKD
ncbi:MAG: EAL domain-containing protein [Eubacteriales bacterium]